MKILFLLTLSIVLNQLGAVELPTPGRPFNQLSAQERSDFLEKRKAAFEALSAEERETLRIERKRRLNNKRGGVIRDTSHQTGRILFVNTTEEIASSSLVPTVERLANALRVSVELEASAMSESVNPELFMRKRKSSAVIFIIDDVNLPTLLFAPEEKWAKINIHKLKGDLLIDRLRKEMLRSFIFLCGGISSQYQDRLCNQISNPRQLDEISDVTLSLDLLMRIHDYLPQLGVNPYTETTYRKAVEQGWAPAPTNDVQKAIWNEVHAPPSDPIKITFDPKTDTK